MSKDLNLNKVAEIDNVIEYKAHYLNPMPNIDYDGMGFVVSATKAKWIMPFQTRKINVDLLFLLPHNHIGLIKPYEDLNNKLHLLRTIVVDTDIVINNNLFVPVFNTSFIPKRIKKNTPIGRIYAIPVQECTMIQRNKLI